MAIEIKEYLGCSLEQKDSKKLELSITEAYDNLSVSKDSLMVEIEGIHVGPTRNYTWYTEQALRNSIPSWSKPYQKPLILHHNEKDGKIIGRVFNATYSDVNTRSGTGALTFVCNVSDEEGKKGVEDGRLKTVSIGVIAHDVRCSICGHIISHEGECEHERGQQYNGETCYWMIYDMEAKELSYVIVPSDIYAHNVNVYKPQDNKITQLTESKEMKGELEMSKVTGNLEQEEQMVIDEKEVKEPAKAEEKKEDELKASENDEKVEEKEDDVELKDVISNLKQVIKDLEAKNEQLEKDKSKEVELRELAEQELMCANTTIKEFAIEKIHSLRKDLGKKELLTEALNKRSVDSLMDSIADLKEEITVPAPKTIEVKEAKEEINPETDNLDKIEKVVQESLIDDSKDSSVNNKKNKDIDVKENMESSNRLNEEEFNAISEFYGI